MSRDNAAENIGGRSRAKTLRREILAFASFASHLSVEIFAEVAAAIPAMAYSGAEKREPRPGAADCPLNVTHLPGGVSS